ncbi:uncharacterized protein LOC142768905 [Rhipicephalus microplus]|uniref:uncharacterized protein LOC142768905 n=1 Tax=Rhipicephalus microplus TaxID=6941 RepID=UPI003F6B803E
MKQADDPDDRQGGHLRDQTTEETARVVSEAAPDYSSLAGTHQRSLQSPNDSYIEQPQSEPTNAPAPMSSSAIIPSDSASPGDSVSSSSGIDTLADADIQTAFKTAKTSQDRPPVLQTSTPHGGKKALDSHDDTQYATSATTDTSVASRKTPAANPLHQSHLDTHKPVTPVRQEGKFPSPKRRQPYSQRVRRQPNTAVRFTVTARNIPTMTLLDQVPTHTVDSHVEDVLRGAQGHELGKPQSVYPFSLTTTRQHINPPQATWSAAEVDQNRYVQLPPSTIQAPGTFNMPGTMQYPTYPSVQNYASLKFPGQGNQHQHPQVINFIRPPEAHLSLPAFSQITTMGIQHLPPPLNPYFSPILPFRENNPLMTSAGQYPAVPLQPTSNWHSLRGNQLVQPPIPVHGTGPPPIIVTPPSPAVISQRVSQPALVSQQAKKQKAPNRGKNFRKATSQVSETDLRAVPSTRVSSRPASQPSMVSQKAGHQQAKNRTPYLKISPNDAYIEQPVGTTDPRLGQSTGTSLQTPQQPSVMSPQAEQQTASSSTPYLQIAASRARGTNPPVVASAEVSLGPVPQAVMSPQEAEQQSARYRTPYLQVTPPCASGNGPRCGKSPGGSFEPALEPAVVSQQHTGNMTPYFQIAPPCVGDTDSRHIPLPSASFQPVSQPAMVSQQTDQQHVFHRTPYLREPPPPRTSPTDPLPEQRATDDAHSTGRVTGSQVMTALQIYKEGCQKIRGDMLNDTRALLRQLKAGDGSRSQSDRTRPSSAQSKTKHVISQVLAVVDGYVSQEEKLSATMFNAMTSLLKSMEGSQENATATTDVRRASKRRPTWAAKYKKLLYITDAPRRFACEENLEEQTAAAASTVTTCDPHLNDNSELTRESDAIVPSLERLCLQTPPEHRPDPEERTSDIPQPVQTVSTFGAARRRLQEFQRLCPSNPEAKQDDTVASQPASVERPPPEQ